MIRTLFSGAAKQLLNVGIISKPKLPTFIGCMKINTEQFSNCTNKFIPNTLPSDVCRNSLLLKVTPQIVEQQLRTVTKFSLRSGKRKSVKAVLKRFYRLSWGIWIRTKAGRQKRLWKKSVNRKRRLQQHVFCNATQSKLLDKMTTRFWHRRKYYVDDPYEPYHTREEYEITRRKPKFYY